MGRRTSLPVETLYKLSLDASQKCNPTGAPECYYANELGAALEGGTIEEKKEAKEALHELLESNNVDVALIAFFYLFSNISRNEENTALIADVARYENNPENAKDVAYAKKKSLAG